MEKGLQSEDLKFFQELIGKYVFIHLKSRLGEAILDENRSKRRFEIVSVGKKFIKARNADNKKDIIILNIDDIAYIYGLN